MKIQYLIRVFLEKFDLVLLYNILKVKCLLGLNESLEMMIVQVLVNQQGWFIPDIPKMS